MGSYSTPPHRRGRRERGEPAPGGCSSRLLLGALIAVAALGVGAGLVFWRPLPAVPVERDPDCAEQEWFTEAEASSAVAGESSWWPRSWLPSSWSLRGGDSSRGGFKCKKHEHTEAAAKVAERANAHELDKAEVEASAEQNILTKVVELANKGVASKVERALGKLKVETVVPPGHDLRRPYSPDGACVPERDPADEAALGDALACARRRLGLPLDRRRLSAAEVIQLVDPTPGDDVLSSPHWPRASYEYLTEEEKLDANLADEIKKLLQRARSA